MSDPDHLVELLKGLYQQWSHSSVRSIIPLPESGSYRRYFRIYGEDNKTAIGVYNSDDRENRAFIYLGRQLLMAGNNVPEIYAVDLENKIYLEEDLGDTTLLDYLQTVREERDRDSRIVDIYRRIIDAMPGLQVTTIKGLDISQCYPRVEFDEQSMMWDLNYFKYNLLKPLKIHFYEQDLEDDFQRIIEYLSEAPRAFFMFRDFQSRNIMLPNSKIYFIDFQGGRRGPLQYDLASLLFEAKTDIPPKIREYLLEYYLELFTRKFSWFDPGKFQKFYYGFVYLRLMQAMGAYGFRGLIEHKPLFLQSLPLAIQILDWLIIHQPFPVILKSIPKVFKQLINLKGIPKIESRHDLLTVTINSFSYRDGIPLDISGHGGGFVFDCRALHNPGKLDEYKELTGLEKRVIDFLNNQADVQNFLSNSIQLVDQAVSSYLKRGFKNLFVCYGCTGGRHRSVYMSEKLKNYLENKYRLNVVIHHTGIENTRNAI